MTYKAPKLIALPGIVAAIAAWGFAADPAQAEWLDSDWSHRMSLTAVEDSIAGTQSHADFPLLVVLDGSVHSALFAAARGDGGDLVFTEGDGSTVLSHELVEYDSVSESAEIWVRTDSLSRTHREFFVYFDNPDTLVQYPTPAWSEDYRAVYHFADDPGGTTLSDSSPAAANITLNPIRDWQSSDAVAGQVGQGWFFNGSTHYLSTRSISTQDSSYVLSAWLELTSRSTDFFIQANPDFWHLSSQIGLGSERPDYAEATKTVRWYPSPLPINEGYHLFTWVFDAVEDTIHFYYDGEPQGIESTFPANLSPFYTGRLINPNENEPVGVLGPMFYNEFDLMTGGADEFRLLEKVRSADWIRTEYRNQNAPLDFFVFGAVEDEGATAVDPAMLGSTYILEVAPNPTSSTTVLRFATRRPQDIRIKVYDIAGREVAGIVDDRLPEGRHQFVWDGRGRGGSKLASGIYFVRLSTGSAVHTQKIILLR